MSASDEFYEFGEIIRFPLFGERGLGKKEIIDKFINSNECFYTYKISDEIFKGVIKINNKEVHLSFQQVSTEHSLDEFMTFSLFLD